MEAGEQPGATGTRRRRLLLRSLLVALFLTLPVACAVVAVRFAPPAHLEIAGADISVKPVLGQDTSRLQNGALVRAEHAEIPLLQIPVGVDVSADWNRLIPRDRQTRRYLVALWDDPEPELHRIRSAARDVVIEWGLIGFLTGAVAVGAVAVGLRERRARLDGYTRAQAALVAAHNRRLRLALAGAAGALCLVVEGLAVGILVHRDHHVVASSPVFAGTTLEGTEVNGLMSEVLPFLSILRPRSTFYDTVSSNLTAAIDARPGLRHRRDGDTIFVLAEDFEDVNGMARQVGLTADLVDADFLALTGDLTFGGKPIETYLIDTLDFYSGDRPVWFAPGLHDTEAVVRAAAARGWHVADGTTQQQGAVRLLAAGDPRVSLVGDFGVGDVLRDPDVDLDTFVANTEKEACATRPDFVLLHDHVLGREIAAAGCQRVAVLDGRSYQFLGPQEVPTTSGGLTYELTNGSAGGHVTTDPDPGDIQHPARFVILHDQPSRHRTTYAVVTVLPDTRVSITPEIDLRVPYAEYVSTGRRRPPG